MPCIVEPFPIKTEKSYSQDLPPSRPETLRFNTDMTILLCSAC